MPRPHHTIFSGSTEACARLLPYAKRKLRLLSDHIFSERTFWEWRRAGLDGGAEIRLERQGPIEYIYIKAGLVGYEFATVVFDPGNTYVAKMTLTQRFGPAGGHDLRGRNSKGGAIDLANDGYFDQRSAFLCAGGYMVDTFTLIPMHEWYQIPLGSPEQIASWQDQGYTPKTFLAYPGFGKRYADTALSGVTWYDGDHTRNVVREFFALYVSEPIRHGSGKSRYVNVSALNDVETYAYPSALYGKHCGSAAMHNEGYFIAATWEGCDYTFMAEKGGVTQVVSGTVPSYVNGHVYTRWHFRGDGHRALSLQRGWDGPDETYFSGTYPYPTYFDTSVEEVEFTFDEDGVMSVTGTIGTGDTKNDGIVPLAVDYDFYDQSQRKIGYFDVYMGPEFLASTNEYTHWDQYAVFIETQTGYQYFRSLLIYFVVATMDEAGAPDVEVFRTPVFHEQYWNRDVDVPPSGTLEDGSYWGQTGSTPNTNFISEYGYSSLRGSVSALDLRADAWVVQHSVHLTAELDQDYAFRRHWAIWGESRDMMWAYIDGGDFVQSETMTGDPVGPLESGVPSGFDHVDSSNTLWTTEAAQTGWFMALFNNFFDAQVGDSLPGAPVQMATRRYDGFHIHPNGSFSLLIQGAALCRTEMPQMIQKGAGSMPGKSYWISYPTTYATLYADFFRFDHIEHVQSELVGGTPTRVVTTSTHLDVFNIAHDETFQAGWEGWGEVTESDQELQTVCAQGVWIP